MSAPDGGVDGTATGSPRRSIHGLVKEGDTAYQCCTGAFTPASSIADILLTGQGEVKARIRSGVEGGGTLVVMLFGWDGTARTDSDTLAEPRKRGQEDPDGVGPGSGQAGGKGKKGGRKREAHQRLIGFAMIHKSKKPRRYKKRREIETRFKMA